MAIKGSLREASLPDVLQLLSLGRKTGCLTITDRANLGYIYFREGRICYASVVNRRDRLGDILVKSGLITANQLQGAVESQGRQRDTRLGEILVNDGALTRQDLEHYMRVQIEEAVFFLFTWPRGSFNFESDVEPDHQDFLVSINPESLLLEGARRVDEWSLIQKKIPSFDLIFTLDHDRLSTSDAELTPVQQRILPLLDGERDVQELVEDSGLVEFEVGKAVYGLVTAGFAQRKGRSQVRRTPTGTDVQVEEHRNLGTAFFRTGMLDEAAREFRRVVELRDQDLPARFHLGLIAAKQSRWEEAVEHLEFVRDHGGTRGAVFADLALAYERLGRLDDAESSYADAVSKARHDPRIMIGWATVAVHRGDFEVAAGRLERARELLGEEPPSPQWYWARSLAAVGQDDFIEADAILEEGLQRYADHAVLRNNHAVILEALGRLPDAEAVLRAALTDDPSLPHLSKNLGDLMYRSGQYDEAWEAYHRALKLKPDLGDDVYFKLGNIAYKQLDRARAAEFWGKTLELNPRHELARTNLDTMGALA